MIIRQELLLPPMFSQVHPLPRRVYEGPSLHVLLMAPSLIVDRVQLEIFFNLPSFTIWCPGQIYLHDVINELPLKMQNPYFCRCEDWRCPWLTSEFERSCGHLWCPAEYRGGTNEIIPWTSLSFSCLPFNKAIFLSSWRCPWLLNLKLLWPPYAQNNVEPLMKEYPELAPGSLCALY